MSQVAKIHSVTIVGNDSLETKVDFSCHDDDAVSYYDTINAAHACFLVEHTAVGSDTSAYGQMMRAIVNASDAELYQMVGREFHDEE